MPAALFVFRAVRIRRWSLALVVALVAVGLAQSSGPSDAVRADASVCTSPRPLPVGTSTRTFTHAGQQRSFLLRVPPGYDGTRRVPVVFLFHGLGGTSEKVVEASGIAPLADLNDFIVVAPQALGDVPEWDFRSAPTDPVSDVSSTHDLVSAVQSAGCVDSSALFAEGFSNGSALVLAMACDPQSPFAAYGAVAGPYMTPDCARAKPASIAYFHGLRDTRVPYAGAETVIGPMPAVDDTMARWVDHDRCPAVGATTTATGVLRHYSWRGCADQSAISVYVLEDGDHRWPVSDIDATSLMWQFFTRAIT